VKLEFVKQKWTLTYIMWASGFVRLYNDSVYDMYAPVVIQDTTLYIYHKLNQVGQLFISISKRMKEATSSAEILRIDLPCINSPFCLKCKREVRLKHYNRMKNDHRFICACYFSFKIGSWGPFCQCQIMGWKN
jgi:hypothetical protein